MWRYWILCGWLVVGAAIGGCGGGAEEVPVVLDVAPLPPPPDLDQDGIPDADDADRDGDAVLNDAEVTAGTNPDDPDTDHDAANDGADNCPVAENADQRDTDADGRGDACADDDDADGLPDDIERAMYGTDPLRADSDADGWADPYEITTTQTNPLLGDSDADGRDDPSDHYPLDGQEWADTDGDTIGDNGDNCPQLGNADQRNTDAAYAAAGVKTPAGVLAAADALGDVCDADLDGDGLQAVYVDAADGNDAALGSYIAPLYSVRAALVRARAIGAVELRIALGSYEVGEAVWSSGLTIRGGYQSGFASVVVKPTDAVATRFTASGEAATVVLDGLTALHFDSLAIAHTGGSGSVNTLTLHATEATLTDVVVTADPSAATATVVQADAASTLTVARSALLALDGSGSVAQRTGLVAEGGTLRLMNVHVAVLGASHARGVVVTDTATTLVHTTIAVGDADALTANALDVGGGTLRAVNNIFQVRDALDQSPLQCSGAAMLPFIATGNGLVTVGGQGPQPFIIDCQGRYDYGADETAFGSVVYGNGLLAHSALVDPVTGQLMSALGIDMADTTAAVADGITDDFFGTLRTGAYDVGAMESPSEE
ncbi:MAG: thrombospondin type 3 repeat-containing protein [Deltaproteobacteria bacterium]|nr:thrombospondin type 3 repeat-containing protein [Deltaproteobacteria bacterium]